MKQLSFLFAFVLIVSATMGQTDSIPSWGKLKKFNVMLRTLDKKTIYGQFHSINDSEVLLSKLEKKPQAIPAENIKTFTLKRKNSVLRGALIGFGVGALTGVIIGFASGDDELMEPSPYDFGITAAINNAFAMTAGQKAVAGGVGLGASGAIVGMIIGAIAKKKFTIGGRKEKFRDLQANLMARLVQK